MFLQLHIFFANKKKTVVQKKPMFVSICTLCLNLDFVVVARSFLFHLTHNNRNCAKDDDVDACFAPVII